MINQQLSINQDITNQNKTAVKLAYLDTNLSSDENNANISIEISNILLQK